MVSDFVCLKMLILLLYFVSFSTYFKVRGAVVPHTLKVSALCGVQTKKSLELSNVLLLGHWCTKYRAKIFAMMSITHIVVQEKSARHM